MSRLLAPLVLALGLAAPAPAALAASPAHPLLHVVQSGDTLSGIAHRYGCPLEELVKHNHLRSDHIVVGAKLRVPWPDPRLRVAPTIHVSVHRVLPGDSLLSIADRYDADARSIRLYNSISGDRIRVGQRLEIPTAGPALTRHTFGYEVRPGDTAVDIARRLDVPLRHLRYLNPGVDLRNLEAGQQLTVYRYEPLSDEAATTLAPEAVEAATPSDDLARGADGGADDRAQEPVDIDIDDFDDAEDAATPGEQADSALKAASEVVARAAGVARRPVPAPSKATPSSGAKPSGARPTSRAKAPAAAKPRVNPQRALAPKPSPKAGDCRCTCPPPAGKRQASDDDDDFAYERGE